MRRASGVLTIMAGAALIATTTGVAIGQEENAPPEGSVSPAAEAPSEAAIAEPSTLSIDDVAADRLSFEQLRGKKYKKAVAKAMPVAARFAIDNEGDDAIGRIIGLSLAARAADEAGDPKTAKALIDVATLLYRNEWTSAKSDPLALNRAIEEVIAAEHPEGDPALIPLALWQYGFMDMCVDLVMEEIPSGITNQTPDNPWFCDDQGGRKVRTDATGTDPSNPSEEDLDFVDAGGIGIHKVVQDGSANDKLTAKKYKKALTKVLKKSGARIAGYTADERGVIEMVLAARTADEAGDQKAAQAFMGLALAAYRNGVPDDSDTAELNAAIDALIGADYAGIPGLELYPPEGEQDWCFNPDGTCAWLAGAPHECDQAGLVRERITPERAVATGCQFE